MQQHSRSLARFLKLIDIIEILNDKSAVGIIVDYSRDYTVVDGVKYFFQLFSLLICETTYFNLLKNAK